MIVNYAAPGLCAYGVEDMLLSTQVLFDLLFHRGDLSFAVRDDKGEQNLAGHREGNLHRRIPTSHRSF